MFSGNCRLAKCLLYVWVVTQGMESSIKAFRLN